MIIYTGIPQLVFLVRDPENIKTMDHPYSELEADDDTSTQRSDSIVSSKIKGACKVTPCETYYTITYGIMASVTGSFLVAAPLVLPYIQNLLNIKPSESSLVFSLCYIGLIIGSTLSGPVLSQTKFSNTHLYFIFSASVTCCMLIAMLFFRSFIVMLGIWTIIGIGLGTIRSSLSVYSFRISAYLAAMKAINDCNSPADSSDSCVIDKNKDKDKDSKNENTKTKKDKNNANRGAIMLTRINFAWDLSAALFAAAFNMNYISLFWFVLIGMSIIYCILLFVLPTPPIPATLVSMELDSMEIDKCDKNINENNDQEDNDQEDKDKTDKTDKTDVDTTGTQGNRTAEHAIITPDYLGDSPTLCGQSVRPSDKSVSMNNFNLSVVNTNSQRSMANSVTVSYNVVSQILTQTQTAYENHFDSFNPDPNDSTYRPPLKTTVASFFNDNKSEWSNVNVGATSLKASRLTTNVASIKASFEISQIAKKETIAIERAVNRHARATQGGRTRSIITTKMRVINESDSDILNSNSFQIIYDHDHDTPGADRMEMDQTKKGKEEEDSSLVFKYKHEKRYIYLLLSHFFLSFFYEAFLITFSSEYCIYEINFSDSDCVSIGTGLIAIEQWGKFTSGVLALFLFNFISFYFVTIVSQFINFLAMLTFLIFQLLYAPPFGIMGSEDNPSSYIGSLCDKETFVDALYVIYFIMGFNRALGLTATFGIVEPVAHVTPLLTIGSTWVTSIANAIAGYGMGTLLDHVGYDLMPPMAVLVAFFHVIVIFTISYHYRRGSVERKLFLDKNEM